MPARLLWTKQHIFRNHMRGCVTFSTIQPKVGTIGIDFGSKNSRVAIIESLVPKVVGSEIGRSTPSYVTLTDLKSDTPYGWCMQHLDRAGKFVSVGHIAKHKMLQQPSDVVFNVKKLIGKPFDNYHIQEMRKDVYFSIVEGPEGQAWLEIHGVKFSPVEICCAILEKLKDCILMYKFHHKLQVVMSVPTFFSKQQREDVKLAAITAGLDVLQVIDESKAAVLSTRTKGLVIAFGMGAGSHSISVLHVDANLTDMKVKAHYSDPFFGGDQFDSVLLEHFVSQILDLHSVDVRDDKYAMAILAEKAEQVKVDLSYWPEVTVSIPYFTASAKGPVDFNVTISRLEFEMLIDGLIGQIEHNCQSVLKEANITDKDIDDIVLFGGMARMPKLQRTVCEFFGKHQSSRVNPEEAVVIGSAIQAALLVEESQEISEDSIPLSIGMESANGTVITIIPRNTKLPAKQRITIPCWCGYGDSLCIRICIGEHVMGSRNLHLGEVQLINNSLYEGSVDFEVKFEVDKDHVVKVTATDGNDIWRVFKTLIIDKNVLSKHNVNKAVRGALLNWATETQDPTRNLARYILNTLADALSARRDELPEGLRKDAVNAFSDLQGALDADAVVLKDKAFTATSMLYKVLNWMPSPSESTEIDNSDDET